MSRAYQPLAGGGQDCRTLRYMRGFSVKALPDTHPLFDMLEQIEHGKEVVVLTLTRRSGESLIIETPG